MRTVIIILVASVACIACRQPSNPPDRRPTVATPIALPDRYYVLEAALRYMLNAASSYGVEREYYSAYVLPKDGEFTSELVAAFAGYKPLVTASVEVATGEGEARDKATGKRVELWFVDLTEIHGKKATAKVSFWVAPIEAATHTLQLRRRDGKWIVVSEKIGPVSWAGPARRLRATSQFGATPPRGRRQACASAEDGVKHDLTI